MRKALAAKKPNGTLPSRASAFFRTLRNAPASQFSGVKDFCATYGVSQDTFSRLAGFSPRAIANWAQGRKPSTSTERRLNELTRLFAALEKLVEPAAIGPWLKEPNPAFDGSTPVQVIERGDADRLWRMIYELESGEPG
jgi:DNA-binding transcriptional regulator YiaG